MNMSIAAPARWAARPNGSPASPEATATRSAWPAGAQAPAPATDRIPVPHLKHYD